MLTALSKGVKKNENFATGVNDTLQWCTLSCEYLHEFFLKIATALMVYLGARGKILWHCPSN
jgi:hypothetical protein